MEYLIASLLWWPSEIIWLLDHSDRSSFFLHHLPIIASVGGSSYLLWNYPVSWLWAIGFIAVYLIGALIEKIYADEGELFWGTMVLYRLLFGFIPIALAASIITIVQSTT
jgi:hypothetical protein